MSLYSALYAGVSGLNAQSSAMAAVADNITNINTIGYKGVQSEFRTLVTDGGGQGHYSAGGVTAVPQAMISNQGLLQASSSTTDLAIDGSGFFVARQGSDPDGPIAFTRSGSFRPDEQGYLRNASGYYLQGWKLDDNGGYANTGNLDALEPVRVSQLTGSAVPTSKIQMRANLQSDAAITTGYTAGDMAAHAAAPATGVTPQFSRSIDIYDAQGGSHRVTLGFAKTGANTWVGEVYAEPASDVTGAGANGLLAQGQIVFNPDGSLKLGGAAPTSDPALFGSLNVTWANEAGSTPIDLQLGANGELTGLTQFGGESAMISSAVDGGPLGNISSIEVSDKGIVSAIFEDGTSRAVFQLPVATFQNPDGLARLSGNAYGVSNASGAVAINPPGALGGGTIASSALEASNVDLAGEFTNMIRFQRAYSAASKIITTVDDMLQEVSNLKR